MSPARRLVPRNTLKLPNFPFFPDFFMLRSGAMIIVGKRPDATPGGGMKSSNPHIFQTKGGQRLTVDTNRKAPPILLYTCQPSTVVNFLIFRLVNFHFWHQKQSAAQRKRPRPGMGGIACIFQAKGGQRLTVDTNTKPTPILLYTCQPSTVVNFLIFRLVNFHIWHQKQSAARRKRPRPGRD